MKQTEVLTQVTHERPVSSSLHELDESKLPFVSRIEFIRSKICDFSAHVSDARGEASTRRHYSVAPDPTSGPWKTRRTSGHKLTNRRWYASKRRNTSTVNSNSWLVVLFSSLWTCRAFAIILQCNSDIYRENINVPYPLTRVPLGGGRFCPPLEYSR